MPLLAMAAVLGVWRINAAQKTAEELFDRSLLSAALAISRDVILSDGDVVLPSTRELIRDASGGEVFYHATGPGGIYVTGYAYPPVVRNEAQVDINVPNFFEATYRGESVRVLRVTEWLTIENVTGEATVTVWQRTADRAEFVQLLVVRAAALIGGLLATLILVIWFGVNLGLRPLTELQEAIAMRSPDDLSRIKRAVPTETKGIVRTLNHLFGQVERSMEAHQTFISDAAHQLRNPAAAVQSMAEALRDAPSDEDRKKRTEEMVVAAQASARVANQLLSLDRLQHSAPEDHGARFDLVADVRQICSDTAPMALSRGIDFELDAPQGSLFVQGDQLFIGEAVKNLIDNALKHGGEGLGKVVVTIKATDGIACVTVADDGKGLSPGDRDQALGRFKQVSPGDGSGLGLAIVASVVERHGGALSIDEVPQGASITLSLPVATSGS